MGRSQRYASAMCMQCAMGGPAPRLPSAAPPAFERGSGRRAFAWMTPGRMRATTIALLVIGVIGASVSVSGT